MIEIDIMQTGMNDKTYRTKRGGWYGGSECDPRKHLLKSDFDVLENILRNVR